MKLSLSRVNIDSGFFSSLGKYLNKTSWANLLFCCSPLLVFIIIFCALRVNPFRWVPLYCDEVGWYMQVNSVIEYGMPPVWSMGWFSNLPDGTVWKGFRMALVFSAVHERVLHGVGECRFRLVREAQSEDGSQTYGSQLRIVS